MYNRFISINNRVHFVITCNNMYIENIIKSGNDPPKFYSIDEKAQLVIK